MLDGYAPPEDADAVLEAIGPQMISRFAANLRAAREGTLAESLILRLDKGKNGGAIWTVETKAMEPAIVMAGRKRA
jgi:hypothetical protein